MSIPPVVEPVESSVVEPVETPFRPALSRVSQSARGLTSVATTRRECAARCRAWTPHPVPRSRARETGSRSVSWAREVAAGLMPSPW